MHARSARGVLDEFNPRFIHRHRPSLRAVTPVIPQGAMGGERFEDSQGAHVARGGLGLPRAG